MCSYIPLDTTSLNHDDQTEPSCNDVSTDVHAADGDMSDMADATCGYSLPAAESNNAGVVDELRDPTADDDDLIHNVSSSQLNTVSNDSQHSSSVTYADAHNSSDADISDRNLSCLPIGRVGFRARLRVNVENLTELQFWQKSFAERSKTTMRYANVALCAGKKTLYKVNSV